MKVDNLEERIMYTARDNEGLPKGRKTYGNRVPIVLALTT